jgi:hypothetical protein
MISDSAAVIHDVRVSMEGVTQCSGAKPNVSLKRAA